MACSVCVVRLKRVVTDGHFGHSLLNLVSKSASGLSIENQPGDVIKEEIEESLSAGISFVVRDWREAWSLDEAHKADPRYHRPM